ncbi:MAG: S1C family serine protease [Aeoliella sp.]
MSTRWIQLTLASLMVVVAGAPSSLAQEEQEDREGAIIQLAPDAVEEETFHWRVDPRRSPRIQHQFQEWLLPGNPADIARQTRPASPYYIGIGAQRVSDQLRAHVDLPENVGLIVTQVVDDGPAAEAEIKRHDILLRADGHDLKTLEDLMHVVSENSGETMTQFTIDIIRRGQPETLWVTPAERPRSPAVVQPGFREQLDFFDPARREMLERMLERAESDSGARGERIERHETTTGVSISMHKQNDGPMHITVKRDGETWEIEGDDAEALNELPEDLRPMVEKLLEGHGATGENSGHGMSDDMRKRIERMEQEMHQIQEQFQKQNQQQHQE